MVLIIKRNKIAKKPAFTVVAALVALFVVSITLAMMIPIVKLSNEKNSLKEAWKDDFSQIVRAYSSAKKANFASFGSILDNVPAEVEINQKTDENTTGLDILKYCGYSTYVCGVYPATPIGKGKDNIYKTLSNGFLDEEDLSQNQFLLENGANVYTRNDLSGVTNLWVDVNGYVKGPNRLGRDLFGVIIAGDRVIPMGTSGSSERKTGGSACNATDTYVPIGSSGKASDYAGATCSMTILLEDSK